MLNPNMIPPADILRVLRENRDRTSELGALYLGVFGSVARGEARPDSDVDILVELDEQTFDRYMDLKIFIEDLLDRRVDLVQRDRIKPALRDQILSEVVDAA